MFHFSSSLSHHAGVIDGMKLNIIKVGWSLVTRC